MAKPIAFIDASYLVTLSNLGDLGGAILAKIAAKYEIHTTQIVVDELTGRFLSPNVQSWLDNTSNFVKDPAPATASLLADIAIKKNGGDLSIYEAAKHLWWRNNSYGITVTVHSIDNSPSGCYHAAWLASPASLYPAFRTT